MYTIIRIILVCLICGIFLRILKFLHEKDAQNQPLSTEKIYDGTDSSEESETENIEEFDKDYFERCQNGEAYQLFLEFASVNDCTFIQGLLFAKGIPSHTEHQHMNRVYAGTNIFAVQLWILVADYEPALEIVMQFVSQKSENLKNNGDSGSTENIAKLIALLTASHPISKNQQMLGIKFFPKLTVIKTE